MRLQVLVKDKTPEQLQFEIEQELIGVNSDNFERDKKTILDIYEQIFLETKNIPMFTAIEQKVAEINYDICYRVSVIEFETYYEKDAVGSAMNFYSCSSCGELENYIDIAGVLTAEIDFLTSKMFNELCSSKTREVEDCIKEVLDSSDVVYEDDTGYHPANSEILFSKEDHCILMNDAQMIMFPGIHADEYGYESNAIYDDCDNISNCIIRRRRKIPGSRLIKSGGD